MSGLHVVVTTIQEPTSCMRTLVDALPDEATLHVVGDTKGPRSWDLPGARLYSIDDQRALGFRLAEGLPTGHYARKNLGYLEAMRQGAEVIYETDDDNEPLPSWRLREPSVEARPVDTGGWWNAYRAFHDGPLPLWPRGYPLRSVREDDGPYEQVRSAGTVPADAPVQQGLANGSPDVDAVWRLVLDRDVTFDDAPSVLLRPGTWCPFNSQSTWWWPPAFPLLYLPSHCSFRMTDIWRSFVAQRCLWELGSGVAFHAAEVRQDRNEHDLLRDFSDEVPGYEHNERIRHLLDALPLQPGPDAVLDNLRTCWAALIEEGFVGAAELPLVDAWIADVGSLAA